MELAANVTRLIELERSFFPVARDVEAYVYLWIAGRDVEDAAHGLKDAVNTVLIAACDDAIIDEQSQDKFLSAEANVDAGIGLTRN